MNKIFEVLHVFGDFVSFPLNPDKLVGDLQTIRTSDYILALVPGVCICLDSKGYVADMKTGVDADRKFAFLTLPAAGYDWENNPAIASGYVTGLVGGGIVKTNNIKEATVNANAKLYVNKNGQMTTTDPGSGFQGVVAYALSSRTTEDEVIMVQVL